MSVDPRQKRSQYLTYSDVSDKSQRSLIDQRQPQLVRLDGIRNNWVGKDDFTWNSVDQSFKQFAARCVEQGRRLGECLHGHVMVETEDARVRVHRGVEGGDERIGGGAVDPFFSTVSMMF